MQPLLRHDFPVFVRPVANGVCVCVCVQSQKLPLSYQSDEY